MINNSKIKRVWGMAEGLALNFQYKGMNRWECYGIPTNLNDNGVYACTIYAEDEAGHRGTWMGWLRVCNGIISFNLYTHDININIEQNSTIEIEDIHINKMDIEIY